MLSRAKLKKKMDREANSSSSRRILSRHALVRMSSVTWYGNAHEKFSATDHCRGGMSSAGLWKELCSGRMSGNLLHSTECLRAEMVFADVKWGEGLEKDYKRCQNQMATKKLPPLQNLACYLRGQNTICFFVVFSPQKMYHW